MNTIRKTAGIVWMALALVTAYLGITVLGWPRLSSGRQEDLVFGSIVCFVLLPIVAGGLFVFGWYAWQDEYKRKPENRP